MVETKDREIEREGGITHHVHDHLGVRLPLVVGECDAEVGHGPEDRHQGLDRV